MAKRKSLLTNGKTEESVKGLEQQKEKVCLRTLTVNKNETNSFFTAIKMFLNVVFSSFLNDGTFKDFFANLVAACAVNPNLINC